MPLRVLISGAGGLIGSALLPSLRSSFDEVSFLTREGEGTSFASLREGKNLICFEGFDLLIHLSGENIAKGAWTHDRKKLLWDSRVKTTHLLATHLSSLDAPPKLILSASGAGFYGQSLDQTSFDETSPQGEGFLAELCCAWERAWEPLLDRDVRIVSLRFTPVLSREKGMLKELLIPFKFCLGGRIGTGEQFVSWVSIKDVVGGIHHVLKTPTLKGPVNFSAPGSVRQKEFSRILASVLHRPALCPLPGWLVELLYGEKGRALLLSSSKVESKKLLLSGYQFIHPNLLSCLKSLL